ncbi:MAG: carboxypeptidase-like regulatory domain-containing protein [Planctomycetes bacterium]|nr:carboxypeptidase-like regulatory domain-containing protein [Planctomycetota bacterium]
MGTMRGKLLFVALAVTLGGVSFAVWLRAYSESRPLRISSNDSVEPTERPAGAQPESRAARIDSGGALRSTAEPDPRRDVGAEAVAESTRGSWRTVLRVVDSEDGSPLSGATVSVRPLDGALTATATGLRSNASGEVELLGVHGTTLRTRASAPGYEAHSRSVAASDPDPVIRLARCRGSVEGVVRAGELGIADVVVRVVDDVGSEWGNARTDSLGRFTMTSLPTRTPRLRVTAVADGWAPATRSLPPLEAGSVHEALLELEPGRSLRVRCVAFDGTPIASALVRLDDAAGGESGHVSDARGELVLANAPNRAFRVVGSAEGWVTQSAEVAASGSDEPTSGVGEVVLRFAPAPTVTGRIAVEAGDAPVEFARAPVELSRATVRFVRVDGLPSDFAMSGTDLEPLSCAVAADGAFACRRLIPGVRYQVVAECAGFAPRDGASGFVLASGEVLDVGTLVLQRGRSVTGRVTEASGEPVAGAAIFTSATLAEGGFVLRGCVAESDLDGRFVLACLPDEEIVVTTERDERVAQAVVSPSTERIELVLRARSTWALTGSCVDELGGPLEGVELTVSELPASRWTAKSKVRTDANGVFRVGGLHAFECEIDVAPDGAHLLQEGPVTVHVGDPSPELVLRASRRIVGQVVREDGSAATQATVAWMPAVADEARVRRLEVDPRSGEFSIRVPVDVAGVLLAEEVGRGRHSRAIPAERLDRELGRLVLAAVVERTVRCRSTSGAPLAGLRIVCTPVSESGADVEPIEAKSDASGCARVALDVSRGWTVSIRWADVRHSRSIAPWSSVATVIDFDGLADAVWLKLRIRSKSGRPLDGQRVLLAGLDELRESRLDRDGRSDFVDLSPGRYEVRLWLSETVGSGGTANDAGVPMSHAFLLSADRQVHDVEVEID